MANGYLGAYPKFAIYAPVNISAGDTSTTLLYSPGTETGIEVFVGGVRQNPKSGFYTVNGKVVSYSSPLPSDGWIQYRSLESSSDLAKSLEPVIEQLDKLEGYTKDLSSSNLLINGDFSVYSEGESGAGPYVCEMWRQFGVTSSSINVTNTPPGFLNGHYLYRDVVGSIFIGQRIESSISVSTQNKPLTFSIEWYDASNVTNLDLVIHVPVTKDEWSSSVEVQRINIGDLSSGRKEVTFSNMPSSVLNGLMIELQVSVSAGGSYKVTGAKLEIGSNATPFVPDDPQVNKAKCQRYYYKEEANHYGYPLMTDTNIIYVAKDVKFPTTMRMVPAITAIGSDNWDVSIQQIATTGFHAAGGQFSISAPSYLSGYEADARL